MANTVGKTNPDAVLRAQVLEELDWDSLVDATQLDVDVEEQIVTLVGTVDSYAHKLAARSAAQAVTGVHDLVDRIGVRTLVERQPTDDDLAAMLRKILVWDALVPDQEVSVAVLDGWVTLTGSVSVAAQRVEVERAVGHICGVRGVTNSIIVERPQVTPDVIRDAIELALSRRALHSAAHIDITVDGGKVTLDGPAQSPLEKRAILGAVSHAPGIDLVCDELRLDEQTAPLRESSGRRDGRRE